MIRLIDVFGRCVVWVRKLWLCSLILDGSVCGMVVVG